MFVMWTVAAYGYLATGSRYSYACGLWVGYGSTCMLRHLEHLENWRTLHSSASFLQVIDQFMACFIVFIVDTIFAHSFGTSMSELATAKVSECLQSTANIVEE